jgi:anti-sigma factor RsiW
MVDFNAESTPLRGSQGSTAEEMDEVYALMMDALDGELSPEAWAELEAHLLANPSLQKEWSSWQAVDELFRTTPAVMPVGLDFTERTLARLPNPSQRFWVLGGLYSLLFFLGLLPLIGAAWLAGNLTPIAAPPVIFRSMTVFIVEFWGLAQVVLRGLAVGAAQFIQQHPLIMAGALGLIGVVILWNNVYRQLTRPALAQGQSTA